jgi:hypothetical protein
MAPIIITINPAAAHLVKSPNNSAVAPNGSAIERSFVANKRKEETPGGELDQNGSL